MVCEIVNAALTWVRLRLWQYNSPLDVTKHRNTPQVIIAEIESANASKAGEGK